MSDPVTNAEIEDVLSSIRRLVSEEPLGGKARKQAKDPENDSFLLTPALRVMEEAEDSGETADAQPEEAQPEPVEPDRTEPADDAPETEAQAEDAWQASGEEDVDLTEIAGPDTGNEPDQAPDSAEYDDRAETGQSEGAVAEETEEPDVMPTLTLEQRIAELEAAIEQAPGEWEPDGSEGATTDETTPIGVIGSAGQPSGQALAEEPRAEPDGDLEHADAPDQAAEVSEAEAYHAEAAGDHQEDQETGEVPETSEPNQLWDDIQPDEASAEALGSGHVDEQAQDAESEPASEPEAAWLAPEGVEAVDLETAPVDEPDWQPEAQAARGAGSDHDPGLDLVPEIEPEPEAVLRDTHGDAADLASDEFGAGQDENAAGTAPETDGPDNVHEADFTPETGAAFELEPEPEADAPEDAGARHEAASFEEAAEEGDDASEPAFDLYAEEALMDEEALREMVSNLVRQELQGVLGERITRNVRRLVRREIQRALAVRDFE
ncbi:MAG: hypothetical protein QNJ44_01305 [Rhodobacter sp.]|nr:hypothetical protein [Rhodobacter sp.]